MDIQAEQSQESLQQDPIKKELEEILEDAKNTRAQIKRNYTIAENKVKNINSFEESVNRLKEKVENSETGVEPMYTSINDLKSQAEETKNQSQQKLEEIDNNLTSVSSKVDEIEQFYIKFEELKGKVENEESGLQAVLGVVTDLKNQIIKVKASGDEDLRVIKNTKEKTTELKKHAQTDKHTIEDYKKTSEGFKNSIGEILELTTASSLKNEFKTRKDEIQKAVNFWKWFLTGSLLFLAISVLVIYAIQSLSNGGFEDWKQWYRYLFVSPIVYLVFLSSKNYSYERDLLEKYSFKAVLSTSLRSYIKLLKDFYFPDYKEAVLDFTLDSTNKIYKEPYSEKAKRKKFIFGIKSIFNIGMEDEDLIEKEKIQETKENKIDNATKQSEDDVKDNNEEKLDK